MDFNAHKADLLAHYVKLARLPGWKDYAWARVKQMAKDSNLYADFPALLTEAMRESRNPAQDGKPAEHARALPRDG